MSTMAGQRTVYALAALRAGAEQVEVAYSFLERPDEVVSTVFTASTIFRGTVGSDYGKELRSWGGPHSFGRGVGFYAARRRRFPVIEAR